MKYRMITFIISLIFMGIGWIFEELEILSLLGFFGVWIVITIVYSHTLLKIDDSKEYRKINTIKIMIFYYSFTLHPFIADLGFVTGFEKIKYLGLIIIMIINFTVLNFYYKSTILINVKLFKIVNLLYCFLYAFLLGVIKYLNLDIYIKNIDAISINIFAILALSILLLEYFEYKETIEKNG